LWRIILFSFCSSFLTSQGYAFWKIANLLESHFWPLALALAWFLSFLLPRSSRPKFLMTPLFFFFCFLSRGFDYPPIFLMDPHLLLLLHFFYSSSSNYNSGALSGCRSRFFHFLYCRFTFVPYSSRLSSFFLPIDPLLDTLRLLRRLGAWALDPPFSLSFSLYCHNLSSKPVCRLTFCAPFSFIPFPGEGSTHEVRSLPPSPRTQPRRLGVYTRWVYTDAVSASRPIVSSFLTGGVMSGKFIRLPTPFFFPC